MQRNPVAIESRIVDVPYVNISFPVQGTRLPADHGYLLYSAIARVTGARTIAKQQSDSGEDVSYRTGVAPLVTLHKADWLAIELISGFPVGRGLIALDSSNSKLGTRNSKLSLRVPADHYRDVLPLAGKRLDIGGHQIRLGLPVAQPLEPASSLYARIVTIKHHTEPETFLDAVKTKLNQVGINGRVELPRDEQGRYRRRIVTIHGKSVVGFSVAVHELNDEASLKLQSFGIGGRRAMGCGIFNPVSG